MCTPSRAAWLLGGCDELLDCEFPLAIAAMFAIMFIMFGIIMFGIIMFGIIMEPGMAIGIMPGMAPPMHGMPMGIIPAPPMAQGIAQGVAEGAPALPGMAQGVMPVQLPIVGVICIWFCIMGSMSARVTGMSRPLAHVTKAR